MNKFNSESIEKLKVEFYSVIGKLHLLKKIMISDAELEIFEKSIENFSLEIDAASFVLGAIRRYRMMLLTSDASSAEKSAITNNTPAEEAVFNRELTSDAEYTDTVAAVVVPESSADNTDTVEATVIPQLFSDANIATAEAVAFPENASDAENIAVGEAAGNDGMNASTIQDVMPSTNTLTMIRADNVLLKTTREEQSVFIVYESRNGCELGCEFTLRKRGKQYNRFECKACRRIVDKSKKTAAIGIEQNPAAIKVVDGKFVDFIKSTHNDHCRVESLATAYARSQKNICVQFKGMYGGTAKQCYDTHSRKLQQNSAKFNITTEDVVDGFKTFDFAKGALTKAHKRKSATNMPHCINPDESINKESTLLTKTLRGDDPDFFLIAHCPESGTIILGKI